MAHIKSLIRGEYRRLFDDRYRIALPSECTDALGSDECVIAKERDGCLSLWNADIWKDKVDRGVELIEKKLELDFLDRDLSQLQRFVRLLSTRCRPVKIAQRGRLLVPEGFREFLGAAPNSEIILVGAGLCLEIWNPELLNQCLREDMGEFHGLMKTLVNSGS